MITRLLIVLYTLYVTIWIFSALLCIADLGFTINIIKGLILLSLPIAHMSYFIIKGEALNDVLLRKLK